MSDARGRAVSESKGTARARRAQLPLLDRLIDAEPPAPSAAAAAINRLRRSRSDKWLGGVCAGLGQMQVFDPELVVPDGTKSLDGGAIAAWRGRLARHAPESPVGYDPALIPPIILD